MQARGVRGLLLLLLALSVRCGNSPTSPGETPIAPPSAAINGTTVTLEAIAYRNLQPSPQPAGRSLILVLRLHSADVAVRNSLTVQSVSTTSNATGGHWSSSTLSPVPIDPAADYVDFVARDGPDWPVGSTLVVAASVRGGGTTVTLGNSGVVIGQVS